MDFNQLSWGALCFYYRLSGDARYCRIMGDTEFLDRLRRAPQSITPIEFEQKILVDYVNIANNDLLIGHNLARAILEKTIELHPIITALQSVSLLDCNLSDKDLMNRISMIYAGLYSVRGLWLTGVSKIAHLFNENLFVILNLDISNHFHLIEGNTSLLEWLRVTQQNALEVTADFRTQGLKGSPQAFLSQRLGYTEMGCGKSLVKYLDEFFWLRFGDNLPVPPRWVPPATKSAA